ncbi:alpha/beta hydrolase [Noviherbaspirillum sp. 17J57-3]|uniref:Alpha/beta hydrolase n=2 Tax=Noviherbaspirillum galbum TaxID=2709383 RepID=A0A6B3SW86_9BURK|nr:alpha/beta hydrolase [Noviherbaspirillum galbum]
MSLPEHKTRRTWRTWLARLTLAGSVIALLGACSPLGIINGLTPGGARAFTDLAYGSLPRQRLDVYAPPNASGPLPVVVFFYGGNWQSGSRTDYAFVGRMLARRGMVVVVADYRLYPEVRYPDFLLDAAQSVAWTRRNIAPYGGDPDRIFVMGHSAGAYNAAMVALDGRWLGRFGMTPAMLRGWIGLAGPYNFLPIENPYTRPVFLYPDTPQDSQPIRHASHAAPPALLVAASRDELVNPSTNTGALAARLREQGASVTEKSFDRVSHETLVASLSAPLQFLAPTLDVIDAFVHGPREALGVPR